MITTTGRAICQASLRTLGVVGDGFTMTDAQGATSLDVLNSFIDSLGTQPQSMYTVTRSVTTCAPSVLEYTIGPGGDFDMDRPVRIQGAGFLVPGTSGTTTEELQIPLITDDMYMFTQMKRQPNAQPTSLYYNPTNTGPEGFGRILLWPILTQAVDITLYVQEFLAQFPNAATEVILVPGLHRMLVYNLAKELLPNYGQTNPLVVQAVLREAGQSMADYKRSNMRMTDLSSDALIGGNRRYGYNINTGTGG